jgi:dihydroxy-acid dehydratase
VAPEAAAGGPLALVRDDDLIALDTAAGSLDLLVDSATFERRAKDWRAPSAPLRGYAKLFHDHVLQADEGCDFDFLRHGEPRPVHV